MAVETITIVDAESGATASIAPSLGFNCFSFAVQQDGKPVEVLWQDPQFRAGTTRASRSGIPILFPFAGRIRNGHYRYQGREYQLEKNDPQGVNAIHGFVFTRPWRVVEQSAVSVTGEFQASIDDPAILSQWPCDFRIRATYSVRNSQLRCNYEVHNPGENLLPWWFGTHPYFRLALNAGKPEQAVVRFTAPQQWELENLLPTGTVRDITSSNEYADGFLVGNREFDHVFTGLNIESKPWVGSVTDTISEMETSIQFGNPFRECVVFIPPHREAICLEPYSGVPNAFELAENGIATGLAELAPGESCQLQMTIQCHSKF